METNYIENIQRVISDKKNEIKELSEMWVRKPSDPLVLQIKVLEGEVANLQFMVYQLMK